MNCSKCGFQIDDNTKFCPRCGNEIIQNNLLYQEKLSTTDGTNTPENSTPKKNKIVRSIVIAFLIVLILASVGYASYYFSFSKYSSVTPKKSDRTPLKTTDTPSKETISDKSSDIPVPKDDTVKTKTDGNYVCSKSASEKLLDSDLDTLSKEDLALARNEIYGRHGYVFKSEPFKSYFSNKPWYKANPDFKGLAEEFNAVESYNIKLFLKYENK